MGLDIRLPIGLMFAIIGALLLAFGLLTAGEAQIYTRLLGVNVNLWWGLAMLLFGIVMTVLGKRATAKGAEQGVHPTAHSPEGLRTEAREEELGLERE